MRYGAAEWMPPSLEDNSSTGMLAMISPRGIPGGRVGRNNVIASDVDRKIFRGLSSIGQYGGERGTVRGSVSDVLFSAGITAQVRLTQASTAYTWDRRVVLG
uniref:Uncharacterized protein n=1 Tax=Candidatus Kentrum sp. FW TaxID=2126338 RepID=A0A450T7L2_9GAMM|nr:MAG: hypothetical protein BECKFW1821A_GA0114235_10727 [Candidatus Kentron sp. FW]VFJ62820.1 MAG: hypothetical protein BECKFW1821B_GA0114236_10777 [Candidatus Kentron sp. FW]